MLANVLIRKLRYPNQDICNFEFIKLRPDETPDFNNSGNEIKSAFNLLEYDTVK